MADVPMIFILAGIAAYAVLAGADFGAGIWTLGVADLGAAVPARRRRRGHFVAGNPRAAGACCMQRTRRVRG